MQCGKEIDSRYSGHIILWLVKVLFFLSRDLIFDPFQCLDSRSRTGHSSNLMNALCAKCPDERFS